MISLSHGGLIALMDDIAEGHDEEVLEWKDKLILTLLPPDFARNPEVSKVHSAEILFLKQKSIIDV